MVKLTEEERQLRYVKYFYDKKLAEIPEGT